LTQNYYLFAKYEKLKNYLTLIKAQSTTPTMAGAENYFSPWRAGRGMCTSSFTTITAATIVLSKYANTSLPDPSFAFLHFYIALPDKNATEPLDSAVN